MEPAEEKAWFYILNHQQQGPVGLFELKKLFEQRILTEDTFIWAKDMNCWQIAKSLELFPGPISNAASVEQPLEDLARNWEELKKDTYPNGRPFVRYLARFFDLSLFSFFIIIFVSIFSPKFIEETSGISIFIFCLILWILGESIVLSIFGNTIGKALLNAKLKTVNGESLDFLTALKRSIFVNAAGMGFGVPIINLFCFYFSYSDLKKNGKSTWDEQIGTVVLYGKVSFNRILFVSLCPITLLVAGLVI